MALSNAEKSRRYRERHPEKARARVNKWRAENPEKAKAAVNDWNKRTSHGRLKDPVVYLLQQARKCARQRGRKCDLTYEFVAERLHPMRCEATGIELSWEWEHPGNNLRAPSLDRIDSAGDYTPDNVQVACWAFNRMKGNAPNELALQLIKEIKADE